MEKSTAKSFNTGGLMYSHLCHYTSVAFCSFRFSLQRQLEYPTFLIGMFLMIIIQYFSGIWMIYVITAQFQSLGGWTFEELAFLYGLALISHGTMVAFFIPTWQMEFFIRDASFDRFKLRPMPVLFQFLCRFFNLNGCLDLIPAITIFLYGAHLIHFPFTPLNILKILLVIVSATMIRVGLYMMAGSVAFWTQRSWSVVMVTFNLFQQGTSYPLTIYPKSLQWILTVVFPVGFISFYPSSSFLNKPPGILFPGSLMILTLLTGVIILTLGISIFHFGLRRYQSSGS